MKATLEFNLPEEREEHQVALDGQKWAGIACGMNEQLRSWMKHGHGFANAEQALDETRKLLLQSIENEGLTL
jgi:hypothetical protein